jgi:hypothetical protein
MNQVLTILGGLNISPGLALLGVVITVLLAFGLIRFFARLIGRLIGIILSILVILAIILFLLNALHIHW